MSKNKKNDKNKINIEKDDFYDKVLVSINKLLVDVDILCQRVVSVEG